MANIILPQSLPPDVNSSVLNVMKKHLESGRQAYGSAAASLTWGIDGTEDGDVNAGVDGERMTARILREWLPTQPNAIVIHSVALPGSKGDTDHILVVGGVVLLIDSKRWKSKRKYSVMPDGSIKRGTVNFDAGKVKMAPFLKIWRGALPGYKIAGVVCIAQDEVFVPYDNNWYKAPYRLVAAENLTTFLDEFISKIGDNANHVNLGLVSSIVVKAIKPYDRRKNLINTKGL